MTTLQNDPAVAAPTRSLAVPLLAYVFAITMAGTTLPSPLYPIYQEYLGFGPRTTTSIYAVYAAGVLAALLLCGRLSDVVGRRPVMAVGVALAAASSALFLVAADLEVVLAARVVSGLSAGLMTVSATAAMVDHARPERRTAVASVAAAVSMLGLGLGPLLAGALAASAAAPLRLPYVAHLVLLVPAAVIALMHPDAIPAARRRDGGALRPQLPRVPVEVRAVFVPAAVAAVAAFSVFGLLTAVEPGLLRTVLHAPGHLLAGAIAFGMFAASATGQALTLRWSFRASLLAGCTTLVVALVLVWTGVALPSLPLLLAGTVLTGLGHGSSFRAGASAVAAGSPPERRAEAIAALMTVAYLSISVPVVLVGLLSAAVPLAAAANVLTVAAAVLAAGAILALRRGTAAGTDAAVLR